MENLYRKLLEFTGDGVYRYTFDKGEILMANQGLVRLLDMDCAPEELVGRRLRDLIVYTEQEGLIRKALDEKGEIHGFEYHFRTLKGADKWDLHDSFVVTDPGTRQRTVEAIVKDITFRKRTELDLAGEKEKLHARNRAQLEELVAARTQELERSNEAMRRSEKRFRDLFEDAPVGYHEIDINGRLTRVNRTEREMLDYAAREMLDRPVWEFVAETEEARQAVLTKLGGLENLVGVMFRRTYRRRDGTLIPVLIEDRYIRGLRGEVIGIRSTVQDITELIQAGEKLRQTMEDLSHSNAELERFAYVASHDLQEPLRMVSSFTQLLARRYKGKLDKDADDFIGFAVDGAERMQRLIADLLAYSRVGTRAQPLAETDCEAPLMRALAGLTVAIQESGATVTHDPLPMVLADGPQLAQVFQNLVGNAIKFRSAEPPLVHISAKREGARRLFAVRDNGIGIAPEYHDRIFVIFNRLHTRQEYPGNGIGLAICKRIIERHGGRIWLESRLNEGTTFYFELPAEGGELT